MHMWHGVRLPRLKCVTGSACVYFRARSRAPGWFVFLAIALCFSLATAVRAQTNSDVASSDVTPQAVVQALQSHDFQRALVLAQALTHAQPKDPRAWTLEGVALASLNRPEDSLLAFKHALQIDPNNVAALEAAAQLEFQAGSPEALPFLQKLLQLNPDDQTAHAMIAALAFKNNDCATAVEHYEKSPQIVVNDVPALSQLGTCLLQLNRAEEALPAFQRMVELQPGDPDALYPLALAQYDAHHYDDAIRTLLPLTEDGPEKQRAAALNLIAAVYEDDQQTPAAVAALQKAISLVPRDSKNYLDLATLSMDHGALDVAADVLDAGLHAMPDSAPLYLERGVLELQMEKYADANADFRKAAALDPRENYSSVALGISLLQQDKLDESVEVVKQRLAKAPDDPTLNYLLAELFFRKGVQPRTPAFDEAESAARRAVHNKPDFALAEDVLTELYMRSGDVDLAEATARSTLKSDPNDQSALYFLIICLRRKGDQAELPQLVQKLAEVTAGLQAQEETRNRFKLIEQEGIQHSH